jgi:type I restriction enzyme S subunit
LARITPSLENGKTAFVDFLNHNESGFGSTEFIVLRAITGRTDPHFVYYLATSPAIRELAIKSMTGTSGRQRVQEVVLRNHITTIPPIQEQQVIAEVLSSIDDKIDLLNRQNETLEEMAQTLFRQWFIEEADDSWEEATLGSFFPIKTGKKDANFSTVDGPYPFFTCSKNAIKAPSYSFDCAAILLAGNGDFNVKRYKGKFEAYQRTYVLSPHEPGLMNALYVIIQWFLEPITSGARGSVINFITKGMIEGFSFKYKPELLNSFALQCDLLFDKVDNNTGQILILTGIRDALLPKLMSGEVRVKLD